MNFLLKYNLFKSSIFSLLRQLYLKVLKTNYDSIFIWVFRKYLLGNYNCYYSNYYCFNFSKSFRSTFSRRSIIMINIIVEPALLLGGIFAIVMIALYSLRFINPNLATDWDIFITTLGIVYSSIIVIHGWRLDPILLFSQVLLIFISFSFCWILIRQREIIRRLIENL